MTSSRSCCCGEAARCCRTACAAVVAALAASVVKLRKRWRRGARSWARCVPASTFPPPPPCPPSQAASSRPPHLTAAALGGRYGPILHAGYAGASGAPEPDPMCPSLARHRRPRVGPLPRCVGAVRATPGAAVPISAGVAANQRRKPFTGGQGAPRATGLGAWRRKAAAGADRRGRSISTLRAAL